MNDSSGAVQVETAAVEQYIVSSLAASTADRAMTQPSTSPHVNCIVSGQTFFDRLPDVAAQSVQLAYSSYAWHFLAPPIPCSIPRHAYIHLSDDQAVRSVWVQRARQDWERLLSHRYEELVAGGVLLLRLHSADEQGRPYGDHVPVLDAALGQLLQEGTLQHDVLNVNADMYFRQPAEMTDRDALAALGFELIHTSSEPPVMRLTSETVAQLEEQQQRRLHEDAA